LTEEEIESRLIQEDHLIDTLLLNAQQPRKSMLKPPTDIKSKLAKIQVIFRKLAGIYPIGAFSQSSRGKQNPETPHNSFFPCPK
jgi:hypothetical protein